MAVIGNLSTNGNLVSKHMDKDDFITVLFHIGQPLYGGGTNYYAGLISDKYGTLTKHIPCQHGQPLYGGGTNYYTGLQSDKHGTLTKHIPCQHGCLTIGRFDKIIHSGEAWKGSSGCINFNLKQKVLEHFLR